MPEPVTTEASKTTETFSSFRGDRGSAAPADVAVTIADPADTGKSAGEVSPPNDETKPKTADASGASQQGNKVEKRKSEIQREIDELVRKREDLKRELLSKSSETAAPKEPATAAAAYDGSDSNDPAPKKPNQNDPKYGAANGWELYEDDRDRWRIDTAKWELRRDGRIETHKATQEQTQKAHKAALETFETRGSEFAADHDDYPELVDKFKNRPISNEVAAVIVNAENGPAILYDLMSAPEELTRIEGLKTPIERLTAAFQLQYKLMSPEQLRKLFPQLGESEDAETHPPATTKPKASAPAPGTRVNGSGGGGSREPSTFGAFRKQKFG